MRRKSVLMLYLVLLFLVSGCALGNFTQKSSPENSSTEVVASSDAISVDSSTTVDIQTRKAPDIIFNGLGDMPLIFNGNIVGTVRINQIERVGIADFTNEAASAASVDYSYSINMKTNLCGFDQSMLTMKCTPTLVDPEGSQIGSLGDIGWSGFSTQISYINDCDTDKYLEVVLQPEVAVIPDGSRIKLSFSSLNDQVIFSDLYVDASVLTNAVKGPGLKTVTDVTKIKSINGARYSIGFHDAHYQWNTKSTDTTNKYSFFNFVYDLKYLNLPTNERHVNTFDSFDSQSLCTPLVVGMQMDSNSAIFYDNDETAMRLMYKDDPQYYPYVSSWSKSLGVGESVSMTCNREYTDSRDNYNPTYIRLRVEFPEEASARTPDELLQFNGRYCVYQLKIEPTELIEKEDE